MDPPPDLVAPVLVVACAMIVVGGIATGLSGREEPGVAASFPFAPAVTVTGAHSELAAPGTAGPWTVSPATPVAHRTPAANATGTGMNLTAGGSTGSAYAATAEHD